MTELTPAQIVERIRNMDYEDRAEMISSLDEAVTLIDQQAAQIAGLTSERDDLAETSAEYFAEMRKAESEAAALTTDLRVMRQGRDDWAKEYDKAESEAAGLRKVIEDAPHDRGCWAGFDEAWDKKRTCTCWKSKALPKKETE